MSDSTYAEPLTDGVKMAFTNLGSGTIRYAVRHDGDTVHSIDDGIDLLGSHQKRSTFVNRVHKALNGTDVDADAVEAELRQWFSDMNETSAEEKREHFMSDTAREIIDGTESVTVYAGESS